MTKIKKIAKVVHANQQAYRLAVGEISSCVAWRDLTNKSKNFIIENVREALEGPREVDRLVYQCWFTAEGDRVEAFLLYATVRALS